MVHNFKMRVSKFIRDVRLPYYVNLLKMSKEPFLDPDTNTKTLRNLREEKARMSGRPAILTGKAATDNDRIRQAALNN